MDACRNDVVYSFISLLATNDKTHSLLQMETRLRCGTVFILYLGRRLYTQKCHWRSPATAGPVV